jgi:hypothetical protein
MTAPALVFLAPPSAGGDHDVTPDTAPPAPRRTGGRRSAAALRMTRGAREAAAGMGVTDADVQRCLDAPDDVTPDAKSPSRSRFRRGGLVVLAAPDGMVLRVERRGR